MAVVAQFIDMIIPAASACTGETAQDFASICRRLRRARNLRMQDQAAAFNCSLAYISAVEAGRKGSVPSDFIDKFVSWLRLDDDTARKLRDARLCKVSVGAAENRMRDTSM